MTRDKLILLLKMMLSQLPRRSRKLRKTRNPKRAYPPRKETRRLRKTRRASPPKKETRMLINPQRASLPRKVTRSLSRKLLPQSLQHLMLQWELQTIQDKFLSNNELLPPRSFPLKLLLRPKKLLMSLIETKITQMLHTVSRLKSEMPPMRT
jgi:hypothetical protein